MKIRELKPMVVTLVILGALVVALAVAVVAQQLSDRNLTRQIGQEKSRIANLTEDTTSGAALEQNYQKLSAKLGRSREASWSRHMPFVMNQLNGIMEADKLKIETLKPDPITAVDGVSRLPLRIGFKASLGDLAKVIRDIEDTNPVLNIESLDIRSSAGSDVLQVDMTVSSFTVVDKNAPLVKLKFPLPSKPVETAEKVPQIEPGKAPAPVTAGRPAPAMPAGPMGAAAAMPAGPMGPAAAMPPGPMGRSSAGSGGRERGRGRR